MMRTQLTDRHEQGGEPIAALNAAEATIYGRFGYGIASHVAEIQGDKRFMGLRPGTDFGEGEGEGEGEGGIRLLGREEARPLLEKVYDAVRGTAVGWADRTEGFWDARLADGAALPPGWAFPAFSPHRAAWRGPRGEGRVERAAWRGPREEAGAKPRATPPAPRRSLWCPSYERRTT
ncbi:hypothetical protein GCM10009850_038020 [Nonomuraea monospora]|uniref:Uncharacterized protein n=2 Tax=Nonomuraea monospora TaxID=568818 RepID=A0ABN3CGP7_9ACTN